MSRALAVALAIAATRVAHAESPEPAGIDVRVADSIEIAQGQSAPLSIAVAVDRGLVVSKDAGVMVDLTPPAGLHVKKRRLARADAVDPGADAPRFAVPVRGDTVGSYVVPVRIRLWLCGGKVCRPVDLRRSATVTVVAAPPPANATGPAPR